MFEEMNGGCPKLEEVFFNEESSLPLLGYGVEDLDYDLKPVEGTFITVHQHNSGWESIRKKKKEHSKGCIFTYFNENKLSLLKVINCEII